VISAADHVIARRAMLYPIASPADADDSN